MHFKNTIKLVVAVGVSELAGIIGAFFTAPAIPTWYANLQKPFLTPPGWVFAPVWTILFLLMGTAAFLVWRNGLDAKRIKIALTIFLGQLALNVVWSFLFFGLHNTQAAFFEIIILWLAILATILLFAKFSKTAAWLLVPYLLWVGFASYLNFSIWQGSDRFVPEAKHELPAGYTLENYQIEKVTEVRCSGDDECQTPFEYLLQSRCPFTSLCLNKKCAVICPGSSR